jgi:hypothetical protein
MIAPDGIGIGSVGKRFLLDVEGQTTALKPGEHRVHSIQRGARHEPDDEAGRLIAEAQ